MKLFELLLLEYTIPTTKYGYWITDTGKILVVDTPAQHADILRDFFKNLDLSNTEAYIRALDAGWIRIVRGPTTMDIEAKTPSIPAISILKQITKEYSEDVAARRKQAKFFVTKSATNPTFSLGRKTIRDAWLDQPLAAANFFDRY